VRFIKAQKLKWWGHVHRMEGRFVELSPKGKRSRGHQRNRWQDEVLKDIRVLGVKNWTHGDEQIHLA
jgi:hypothetical protein